MDKHPGSATKERMGSSSMISVVIVTFNSRDHIIDCLSVLKSSGSNFEIVVVDNYSSDDTIDLIRLYHPDVKLIPNGRNDGFARAVNMAVDISEGEFVSLVNPDCRVSVSVLRSLSQELHESQVGVVAPAIIHPTGRLAVRSAGYAPTLMPMFVHASGISRVRPFSYFLKGFHLYPAGERDHRTAVQWVSGACFLTTRKIWDQVGGLGERWFMYAEDIDFCRKVAETGRSIIHRSDMEVTHVIGASRAYDSGPVWTLWIENLADYYLITYKPSRLTFWAWKHACASIYGSRSVAYRLLALMQPASPKSWRKEAVKFVAYAVAVRNVSYHIN